MGDHGRAPTATSGSRPSITTATRSAPSTRPTHAFSFFATPSLNSQPHGITAGPDGNLWFTEYGPGKIGDDQPDDPRHQPNSLPRRAQSGPFDITAGPDGNLWFTEAAAARSRMINPTTDAITEFTVPSWIRSLRDHGRPRRQRLVHRVTGQIGRINPTTDIVTEYPIPTPIARGVTPGPDGNLWFTDGTTRSASRPWPRPAWW